MEHGGTVRAENKRSSTDIDADRLHVRRRTYCFIFNGDCGVDTRFLSNRSSEYNATHQFFKEFTAPAVVGAFTFVSVFCVDKNRDGRPDAAEKEIKKETRKEVRRDDNSRI